MKKIRILISGINGYLARNLANDLILSEGYEVFGFGKNAHKHEDLKPEISIITYDELELFFKNKGIEIIIHSATNYGRSNDSIESVLETNLILGIRLYNMARENQVPHFINIDTILPKNYSEYSLSKKQFVEWAEKLHESKKYLVKKSNHNEFQFINVEFEHFYGPGAPSTNFISWITNEIKENVQQIKLTDCTQKREFLYITDAVSALRTIINGLKELKTFESITVGSGNPIELKHLIFKLKHIFGSNSSFDFGAIQLPPNQRNLGTYSHSRIKELGWEVKESLESGLYKLKN